MKQVPKTIRRISRDIIIFSSVLLLIFGLPHYVYADDSIVGSTPTSSTQPSTSPDTTSQTNTSPTTTPAPDTTYTYDPTTEHWNTNEWQYDPTTKTYIAVTAPSTSTTGPTTTSTTPTSPSTATPETTLPTTAPSSSDSTATATAGNQAATSIANTLNSSATSGDADVNNNTKAGDATSGNTSATATILNNVNSIITNQSNQNVANFTTNIMGDVNGDFLLQPVLLKALLESGAQNTSSNSTVKNTANTTNNVNLSATSGNATVSKNTEAGSATTGSANTVADVVNIINSMVAANQSFVGNVNIYGNLDGDILVAPGFVPQLIADNQNLQQQATSTTNTAINANDTQSIVNNVKLAAQSGQALVSGNTSAGSAASGNANTNVVIFNLTGHQIIASDSILVFVNVLGTWVGAIVNAPTGTTSALVGTDVSENNQSTTPPSMVVSINNNSTITNNINLASQSGNAVVTDNTNAGNATSGNATASANILNMNNSQISLTGWFGILFINVFGSWIGSFGIDTPAGNPANINNPASSPSNSNQPLNFIPHSINFKRGPIVQTVVTPSQTTSHAIMSSGVAFAPSTAASLASAPTVLGTNTSNNDPSSPNLALMIGSVLLFGASLFGLYRFRH